MSMYAFHRALFSFWESIGVNGETFPAYLVGAVPEGAAFPYITFDVRKGASFTQAPMSATIWYKKENGDSKNIARADFLDSAAAAIPEAGVRLDWEGGFCVIHRSSGDFQSLLTDEEDETVIGGRVGIEVTFYDM